MESNITKILIKRFWKRCVIFLWTANKGVRASPFGAHFHWWSSPLRPQPSPPPYPQEKMYLPLKKYKPQNTKNERVNDMMEAKLEPLH